MAYSFDGTGDYIAAATPTSWTSLSISFWFKTTYTTDYRNIMGWSEAGYDNLQILINYDSGYLEGSTAYSFCFFVGKASGNRSIRSFSDSSLWDGEWHHALCVRSTASGNLAVYIDGVSKTLTGESSLDSSTIVIDESNMPIGARYYKGSGIDIPFVGDIAEVGIYNAVLTAADAVALSKFPPKHVRPTDLQQYYPLVRDPNDIRAGVTGTANGDAAPISDHPPIIYPSHEIVKPPKKGKIWVNDAPSWDSGAVLQKHPGRPSANITRRDEGWYNNAASDTSVPLSATNTQAGDLIVVTARWEGGGIGDTTTITVADTIGNTYTVLGYQSPSTGSESERIAVAYCLASTGTNASNVITVTLNNTRTYRQARCATFSYSGDIEVGSTGSGENGSNVATWTTSPLLNVDAGDLVIAAFGNYNSAGSGVVPTDYEVIGQGDLSLVLYREIQANEIDIQPQVSSATTDTYVALTAVFQSANTGWADTAISVGQVIDITGLSGQLYLGIERADGKQVWYPITVDQLDVTSVSTDDDVPDTESPWVISGIGFGAR